MKIDHHFHLEEGPYSLNWLMRTANALANIEPGLQSGALKNTLEWIDTLSDKLHTRMKKGSFSEEWLKHYLRLGKEKGIERFGVVDHLYRFEEFRPYYEQYITLDDSEMGKLQKIWLDRVCVGSIEPFLQMVRSVQKQGEPISLGVEADYFPGGETQLKRMLAPYKLDFVIGSVHFIDGWGFDNPELQKRFETYDLLELYAACFEHVIGAARSGLFDIIAHLDNIKVFNYRPDETRLIPLYEKVAAALKQANVASEINTGLAYRYPVKEMCPSPAFLKALHEYDVPVMTSSDSHFPDDIGTLIDDAIQLAERTGYRQTVYYKERERFFADIEGKG